MPEENKIDRPLDETRTVVSDGVKHKDSEDPIQRKMLKAPEFEETEDARNVGRTKIG
jgi:hypothetical protein